MVALNLSGSKKFQPRPQGLLLDDFQNGGSSGEGPGDEVERPPTAGADPGHLLGGVPLRNGVTDW